MIHEVEIKGAGGFCLRHLLNCLAKMFQLYPQSWAFGHTSFIKTANGTHRDGDADVDIIPYFI